jgi:predicted small integral membrane protein
MNKLTTICVIRRSKILIVLTAALFGLMTLINNVTDYAAYADYIGHIISMSNTEGNDSRRYRAITSNMFHHRFYWAIISLETIFTFSCMAGTYQLYRKVDAPRQEFHEAKKFAIAGLVTGIIVYQLGGLKEQVQQSVNFLGLLSERYSRFQCIIAMAA